MRIVCMCIGVLMSAAAVLAQSFYVGAAAGSGTTLVGKAEFGGITEVNGGGTTPSLAIRSGVEVTDRFGVEVELSHDLKVERTEMGERGGCVETTPTIDDELDVLPAGGEPDLRAGSRATNGVHVTLISACPFW